MKRITILGLALCAASSLAAAQGYGYGPGMMGQGQGMMGQGQGMMGQGMMGQGAGGGLFAALNLSDEQRTKVLAIQEEHRKLNWAVMGEMRAEQYKLRSMYGTDKLDANKLVEQQKRVDALRQQMFRSRIETHNQIAAVLTPEQRKQLRQLAPWWLPDEPE